jgi:hypothetical protein
MEHLLHLKSKRPQHGSVESSDNEVGIRVTRMSFDNGEDAKGNNRDKKGFKEKKYGEPPAQRENYPVHCNTEGCQIFENFTLYSTESKLETGKTEKKYGQHFSFCIKKSGVSTSVVNLDTVGSGPNLNRIRIRPF